MKATVFALLCAGAALLCSSCITAAVGAATAATGAATSAMGGSAAMTALGLSSLLGSKGAPESMEGHTVTFAGSAGAVKLTFPTGVETNMMYTRVTDKTATLICPDGAERDVYHMTFTAATEGTYAVDSTAADGTVSTGHGTFSIK